jgi:PAS domain S-box-containing protein
MKLTAEKPKSPLATPRRGGLTYLSVLLGILAVVALAVSLHAAVHQNFLLFHSIAELISIGVVIAVFLLVWNARPFFSDACYNVIAIGLLAAAAIDVLHTLSYKGVGVIGAGGGNVPTQFWIAARYLQAGTLLLAPWLLGRDFSERRLAATVTIFLLVTAALVAGVLSGIFPDCFLPGRGLTTFKVVSEYIIAAMLFGSIAGFISRRRRVAHGILATLLASIALTILSELAFTLYADVYGISITIGHFLRLAAVYLLYVALVRFGLTRPYDFMFRHQQEQKDALRAERDRATQYLQAASNIMLALDREGRVTLINRRGCDVLETDEEDILASPWFERFVPEDVRDVTLAAFEDIMAGRIEPHARMENRIQTATGRIRLIDWRNSLLRDGDGELIGVLSSGEDVTALRQAEAERQRMEANMQHMQKLESLGVMAGGVAHEFNNLLSVVMGNADLAAQGPKDPDAIQNCMKHIRQAAERGAHLTTQLLAYTGESVFAPRASHITEVINAADPLLRISVPATARVSFDIADGLPEMHMDVEQIRQVVLSLIRNAGEALDTATGDIAVRVFAATPAAFTASDLQLGAELGTDQCLCIEVADTGGGMDDETLSRCFEPFFSTRFTGRGLGLPAALGIVRSHGGCIHVSSAPGAGTTVVVLLPMDSSLSGGKSFVSDGEPDHITR